MARPKSAGLLLALAAIKAGTKPSAAGRLYGVDAAQLHRAVNKQPAAPKVRCPCCGKLGRPK